MRPPKTNQVSSTSKSTQVYKLRASISVKVRVKGVSSIYQYNFGYGVSNFGTQNKNLKVLENQVNELSSNIRQLENNVKNRPTKQEWMRLRRELNKMSKELIETKRKFILEDKDKKVFIAMQ